MPPVPRTPRTAAPTDYDIHRVIFVKSVINIGFVGRLSTERSPGLFLHAAKHLLDVLSSGAIPTCATPRGVENAVPTGYTTRQAGVSSSAAAGYTASVSATVTHQLPSPASSASAAEQSRGDGQQATESGVTTPPEASSENKCLSATVIAAAAAASERIVFKVAGAGTLTEHLIALSRQLGLSERVEFVGPVEATDMPAFLRSLDIVINPCVCEFVVLWI